MWSSVLLYLQSHFYCLIRYPRSCTRSRHWAPGPIHRSPRCPAWPDPTPAPTRNAATSLTAVSLDATSAHASTHDAPRSTTRPGGLWNASAPRNERPLPTPRPLRQAWRDARARGPGAWPRGPRGPRRKTAATAAATAAAAACTAAATAAAASPAAATGPAAATAVQKRQQAAAVQFR